jgi:hypothetical protein
MTFCVFDIVIIIFQYVWILSGDVDFEFMLSIKL